LLLSGWTPRWPLCGEGWGELVVSNSVCARGPTGRRLATTSIVGAISKKDLEVERFDLPPLRGGGHRGKLFIVKSGKLWEIS